MSFPSSPTNGQQTSIGGVLYEYNSSSNSWKRIPRVYSLNTNTTTFTGTVTVANIITTNGLFWSNGTAFSSGSGGVSSARVYGLSVLFGTGY